jgi:hypothetical protein
LIWGVWHDLYGGQFARFDETADHVAGHAEGCGGVSHCQPLAIFLGRQIRVDSMHSPQRADPMRGPGLALTGLHAHAIQRRRIMLVGPTGRHAAHDRQGFVGRSASMLAGLGFANT